MPENPLELQRPTATKDLAALIFALGFPTLVTLVYFQWLAAAPAAWQQSAYLAGKILQFGFPVFWVLAIYRLPWRSWPLEQNAAAAPPVSALGRWWVGLIFGGLVVALMFGLHHFLLAPTPAGERLAAAISTKVQDLGVASPARFLALGCFYALGHSFLEEYYWRWFVLGLARRFVSTPLAIVLSSLGFAAHHVVLLLHYFEATSPWTWLITAAIAIGGAVWGWMLIRGRSLLAPWLSHLVVDAGIFALGATLLTWQ